MYFERQVQVSFLFVGTFEIEIQSFCDRNKHSQHALLKKLQIINSICLCVEKVKRAKHVQYLIAQTYLFPFTNVSQQSRQPQETQKTEQFGKPKEL